LGQIEIHGDRALAHKKFFGEVQLADGKFVDDRRQTLFRLHRRGDQWKIVGFFGQLPLVE
jgi:ketosteroid isomerase-like protein